MTPARRRAIIPASQEREKAATTDDTRDAPSEDAGGPPAPAAAPAAPADGAPKPSPRRSALHPERVWPD